MRGRGGDRREGEERREGRGREGRASREVEGEAALDEGSEGIDEGSQGQPARRRVLGPGSRHAYARGSEKGAEREKGYLKDFCRGALDRPAVLGEDRVECALQIEGPIGGMACKKVSTAQSKRRAIGSVPQAANAHEAGSSENQACG